MDGPEFREFVDTYEEASDPDADLENFTGSAPSVQDLIKEGFVVVKPLLSPDTYPDVDIFIEEEEDGSNPSQCVYTVDFGHGGKHTSLHEVTLVQNISEFNDAQEICSGIRDRSKNYIRRNFK